METIKDAKEYINSKLREGEGEAVKCPCCNKSIKEWKKTIISTSAADLIKLVALYRGPALHLDDFCTVAKDRNFSQLVLWGLIDPEINDDDSKRASGKWRPTDLGMQFARGYVSVDKYVITYNNTVLRREGPKIKIREALGNKFDYEKLLHDNDVYHNIDGTVEPKDGMLFDVNQYQENGMERH